MKKVVIFCFLAVLVVACASKKKDIEGNRVNVFQLKDKIDVSKRNITISKPETYRDFFGDNSPDNEVIENYKVNNLKFRKYKLSSEKFFVNYKFSNPVIVDNTIYLMDSRGRLQARSVDKPSVVLCKKEIISSNLKSNGYMGKISFYDGKIFVTSRSNEVISVSTNGEVLWRKKINAIPISSPIVENETIYVITNDNRLYALNVDDGSIKWVHYGSIKDSAVLGSADPVIYNNYVVASYSSGELFILEKNSGNPVFSHNLADKSSMFSNFELTDIDSTPVIKNNILMAIGNVGSMVAIDLDDLSIIWKKQLVSLTNVIVNNTTAYIITNDNMLVAIDINDGNIDWAREFDKFNDMEKRKGIIYYKNIFMMNNNLYIVNNREEVVVVNPKNGNILEEDKIGFENYTTPVSVGGKLYFLGHGKIWMMLICTPPNG